MPVPTPRAAYAGWGPSPLEQAERLEQLRLLDHDMAVDTVELSAPERGSWEVNPARDIAIGEAAR